MERERKVVWSISATESLLNSLIWISEESIQGAEIVEKGIYKKLDQARKNPFRFPPDRYRTGNTGNFRSIVIHNYRVSYQVTDVEIRVLRVRHVKQKPQNY